MEKFNSDFDFFWELINSEKNFTFTRYADGEIMLMKGYPIGVGTQAYNIDKWSSPNKLTNVGEQLLKTLNHDENNYYYAISSKTDNINDYLFLKSKISQKQELITFVNLWINSNYEKTKQKFTTLKRDVILICNESAKKENFPFNIIDIHPFPNDCINFWEKNGDEYILDIIEKYKNYKNQLFFISCGPISEIIIHELYTNNPNNTYIDVGSSIDEYVHNKITRPYMDKNSIYSKMISSF